MTTDSASLRYAQLAEDFAETVGLVPSDRWDSPSPCEGWTARDVLEHVLKSEVNAMAAADLTIERTAEATSDPVVAWNEVRDGMQHILDDPELSSKRYQGMVGETTVDATVNSFLCIDLLVHRWDIGRAAGVEVVLDVDQIEHADKFTTAMGNMLYESGASAPPVEVDADASAQDRLLARFGRDPR